MHICYCADARSIHTLRWIAAFASNHDIDLISFDYPDLNLGLVTPASFAALGVGVHLIPRTIPGIAIAPMHTARIIRNLKPDLIHAHYLTQYGFCAAFAKRHPIVASCWGKDVFTDPKQPLLRRMIKYALDNADLITIDGSNYLKPLLQSFLIPTRKIATVYHGVDTTEFSPEHGVPHQFGGTGPLIVSIRGYRPVYDTKTIIRAIPAIVTRYPDARFVIAGVGTPAEIKAFEREVDACGVREAIVLTGPVDRTTLPSLLASTDVYVTTSTSDGGMPVSTLEAMASGCAIVATPSGNHGDLIKSDGVVVVPYTNPDRLADAIVTLLDSPDRQRVLGENARRVVCEHYDYQKNMTIMNDYYERLITGWHP